MTYEFEGKTEKEAIENAANELGLQQDQFDVEILETQKNSLFKKGYVKICVHTLQDDTVHTDGSAPAPIKVDEVPQQEAATQPPKVYDRKVPTDIFEQKVVEFVSTMIQKMGYEAKVTITFHEGKSEDTSKVKKLGLKLESESSSILIGKRGAHLDAMQVLTNVYATKLGYGDVCIILDTENYRVRREEYLVHLAYNIADKVHQTKHSVLLEPMNSYERRIIHTTLADIPDIETLSEGNGAYKRVRIMAKRYR